MNAPHRICLLPFTRTALALATALVIVPGLAHAAPDKAGAGQYFERIATFPVHLNLAADEDAAAATSAEITAVSNDGNTLIYTDSPRRRLGFVDIREPASPSPAGFVQLEGEPTSVAVQGDYALVALNTSLSFSQPDGLLAVFDIRDPSQPKRLASLPMGGQPDSVAVSPSGRFAAVAIENERDEDLDDGLLPQLPEGFLNVIRLNGNPERWKVEAVPLTGLSGTAPADPEPEYVSINADDIAAVTLQENNHVVLVDLKRARVIGDFSAGRVDLDGIDTEEDDRIQPVGALEGRRREPDAEEGGSRGFTLFDRQGNVRYESGAALEHANLRAGHYPESRSENKGIEPEGIAAARYGKRHLLFVGSERANTVAVYDLNDPAAPRLHQLLPAGIGPEGLLAIPRRNLFVVSSEEDSAEDGYRSMLSLYRLGADQAPYPEIRSTDDGLIPWGALSGLVADSQDPDRLYAVSDSYYKAARIFTVDTRVSPALIDGQIELRKNGDTLDYDLEGIALAANGDFWLASEGNGRDRPNLLIRSNARGEVLGEYALPEAVAAQQTGSGFEGVAVVGEGAEERVLVAFQREWKSDPRGLARIGVFEPASGAWRFYHYPLDSAPEGGWVGLSELTALGDDAFLVIERDNRQGPAARVKKLYRIDLGDVQPAAEGEAFPVLSKRLERDLLPDLAATNGWVLDKVEGAAVTGDGRLFVVTDNDGVEDASGETRFMRLGTLQR